MILGLGLGPAAWAQTTVTSGHWDISAHFHGDDDELELELHNHGLEIEEPLGGGIIIYNFGTNMRVPVTIGTNNLGLLWVSPHDEEQAEGLGMPFLGFSAEELENPFTGPVTFTMTGFGYTGSGTGNFYFFEDENLFFNSTSGPGNYGSFSVEVGQHGHGEFGFSDAGFYEITMEVSAYNGNVLTSAPATFTFNVVPEPSTCALLGLGAGALVLMRWRKRSRQS